jgi:hypothetical protein
MADAMMLSADAFSAVGVGGNGAADGLFDEGVESAGDGAGDAASDGTVVHDGDG